MNVKEQHIVAGMTTDMSVSKFDATKVAYAQNIRITQMEGNQGLLCVTNEKGTKTCTMATTDGSNYTAYTIGGTIVGSALIDDQIVIFTHTSPSTDVIIRLDKNTASGVSYDFIVTVLYSGGDLGFSTEHPLETLAVFENENIKKVYWVDGVHQLRCINAAVPCSTTDVNQFNSNPVIDLVHTLSITKRNNGGEFPAGSIQYAFTYHNLYGPETNVFEASPLYELSPKTKGVSADGRTNCSFLIQLTSTDQKFAYVRAYAIIRTSENGTPAVRLLGDFANSSSGISFVDNGALGSTVDASYLLFVGGEPVAPGTFAVKDNTLFLGNIKLERPSIGSLNYQAGQTIAEKIAELREAGTIPLTNKSGDIDSSAGSGYWFYDYTINNNRPSTQMRCFKSKENYRFGIIAQHETGIWSEVLWLGDFDNNILPEFVGHKKAGIFELTSATGVMAPILVILQGAGYKRIAPVVVYPQGTDRKVFCQGLVSATVYNVEDRFNNRPFSQASWFFRPISEGFGIAAVPHATLYPAKLNSWSGTSIITNIMGGAEIEINRNPRIFLPQVKGYWNSQTASNIAPLPAEDMVSLFGNDYFVDTSIVTLNSPDIDLDDSLQQEDFVGLNFRIVGIAYSGYPSINPEVTMDVTPGGSTSSLSTTGDPIDYSKSRYIKSGTSYGMSCSMNYNGYGFTFSALGDFIIPLTIYPWHASNGLAGKWTGDAAPEPPKLNHKIMSNIWFARTVMSNSATSVNTDTIKLFDNTQSPFVPLGDTADSRVYYGDVDVVRLYKKDLLSSGNATHAGESYHTKEVKILGTSTSLADVTRDAVVDGDFPVMFGPVIYTGTGNIPSSLINTYKGGIDDVLLEHGFQRGTTWNGVVDPAPKKNPAVPIKYKSTKHAVIPIAKKTTSAAGVIPSLYRCEALHTLGGNTATPFWDTVQRTYDTGYVPFITEWSGTPSFNKTWTGGKENYTNGVPQIPTLYIGELYRTVDASTRFGGNTEKAILSNIWKRCGDAITIAGALTNPTSGGVTLRYVEGDTYLARYDCLKTYADGDEDVNSLVEIFSTDVETRVNLDARYDNARGLLDNTMVNPTNINLVNRLGYEQTNQFFTYSTQDYEKENIDVFPASITITGEKVAGSEVDNWMSIPLTAIQDLDGVYGPIEALTTYNNEVFAFQHNGFSQLLFNSRVQIPTSDGQPIEITNGMKFQGTRYISNKIGCSNKWSLAHSNTKIYWYDEGTKDLWAFGPNGLENVSTTLGVKGWVEQNFGGKWSPENPTGLRTLHDETYNDIYFIGGSPEANALMFSETLNSFVSLMNYNGSEFMYNVKGNSYILASSGVHQMWGGAYNSFFGTNKAYILRFIANYQPTQHKVFDTVQWRSDSWNALNKYLPNATFNKLQVWNQYQKTEITSLTNTPGKPSPLKKKFNTFRALIPRDKLGNSLTDSDYRAKGISRIRGNYAVVELTHDANDAYKTQFYDLEIGEFL